jgi:hypothetical protein
VPSNLGLKFSPDDDARHVGNDVIQGKGMRIGILECLWILRVRRHEGDFKCLRVKRHGQPYLPLEKACAPPFPRKGHSTSFSPEINLLNDVFYSPQLCISVWCGGSLLCFSFFLAVRLNLLIFTVAPSTETQ